jgi:acylphosphatase
MIRRRVVVRGTVQGVFFRASCQQQATKHGVAGWVANRSDGAVEAVLEGEDAGVEAVLGWCRQGPPRAMVDALEVTEEDPEGLRGFGVR